MRKLGLLAAGLMAAYGSWTFAVSDSAETAAAQGWSAGRVVFEDPVPTGPPAKKKKDMEECTTSCSLAKHPVPDFTASDYRRALSTYAAHPSDEPGEALEQLLFHGPRTQMFIQRFGTQGLPPAHLQFLERELSAHAVVSLRMVDEAGRVRVSYGPTSVPLGAKQHLAPVGEGLQAMEFNGTVMRTGVNYLWSRY